MSICIHKLHYHIMDYRLYRNSIGDRAERHNFSQLTRIMYNRHMLCGQGNQKEGAYENKGNSPNYGCNCGGVQLY